MSTEIERQRRLVAARQRPLSTVVTAYVPMKRVGREWVGRCPFHPDKTPSFTVSDSKRFYHCFGCGEHGDAIAFLVNLKGCSTADAIAELLTGSPNSATVQEGHHHEPDQVGDDGRRRLRRAQDWWHQGFRVEPGGVVDRYLNGRLLQLPSRAPAVLRFNPHQAHDRVKGHWPAMLARVDNMRGQLVGVHVTYLQASADGHVGQAADLKAQGLAKMARGVLRGGAIRLFEEAPKLGLAEGIEDALSAATLSGMPVWSCLDAGKLAAVELPFGINEIVIFADRDQPHGEGKEGVGAIMARRAAARLRRDGRQVTIALPLLGKDFNDQLVRGLP